MSDKLPPCDHDECPPTHCKQTPSAPDSELEKAIEFVEMLTKAHGVTGGSLEIVITAAKTIPQLREQLSIERQASGFCNKHQPNGGTRNCLICGIEKLSHALHQISYLCGTPNEMEVSDYSIKYNEDEVVEQVKQLQEQSRTDKLLIEKLVETVKSAKRRHNRMFAKTVEEIETLKSPYDSALSLATSQGYGTKKEDK